MDQETAELFKVNVGNLPARCRCIIKITYVSELDVQGESIIFKLPVSVASWQTLDLEKEILQETIFTKFINKLTSTQKTSFKASILMPFEIKSIKSPTHKLKLKKTACQAVCELDCGNEALNQSVILQIDIASIHMPRMLVEDSLDQSSRAMMVSFYPEFETNLNKNPLIYFVLDCSNSMKADSYQDAKKLLLLMLKNLPASCLFNISLFGSDHKDLFPFAFKNTTGNLKKAIDFVDSSLANMGNTDLFATLRSHFYLNSNSEINNFILISDGHVNKMEELLTALSAADSSNRIFTCSVGSTSDHYSLKVLAQASGASYDQFDHAFQSKWKEKCQDLIDKIQQPAAVKNIRIEWQNFEKNLDENDQAPSRIKALFNGRRVVAYGFVKNCQQAVLKAVVDGNELSTVVSCPELCVTRGDVIHKLTAKALIDDWQNGVLVDDHLKNEILKEKLKEKIINTSKQYSITSKYTSFVAIEERDEHEKNKVYGEDESSTPKMDDLLKSDKDSAEVDILSYMGYSTDDDAKTNLDKHLDSLLRTVEFENLNAEEKYDILFDLKLIRQELSEYILNDCDDMPSVAKLNSIIKSIKKSFKQHHGITTIVYSSDVEDGKPKLRQKEERCDSEVRNMFSCCGNVL